MGYLFRILINVFLYNLCYTYVHAVETITELPKEVHKVLNETRRIIEGSDVQEDRPYMVYLKLPQTNKKLLSYKTWLCGGVIIHEEYILTSAACIEDAEHFYIVSGTYKYADEADRFNNMCIKNGAKKAIWKCVPKNYVFDGHENDNIRWMNNDIAVVKIEDGFDFERRIRGCDFVPKPICYNNQSMTLENAGTIATIAGWGTTEKYNDWVTRRLNNQQNLLEAHVEIISKSRCKRLWGARYQNIIENYMVCTRNIGQTMSAICNEKYVDCQDIAYDDEDYGGGGGRRTARVPVNLRVHSAMHNETGGKGGRRSGEVADGGFCENDHGGPLVYGSGVNSIVIGVISACLVKERSNKCYGPFLYTSIYKNRQFISCAIYKDIEPKCRRQFRSGVTHEEKVLSWANHPDGPSKLDLETAKKDKAAAELVLAASTVKAVLPRREREDLVIQSEGVISVFEDDAYASTIPTTHSCTGAAGDSPACECGAAEQTVAHIISECPLTKYSGQLEDLFTLKNDAILWIQQMKIRL